MTARRAALLLLLVLAGCPRVPPRGLSRDPAALQDQVRAAQERVQRVRGGARVRITSPEVNGTVAEFAAAEKPGRVHLETLDFFGNPVAVLVARDGRFGFWDARKNVYYRGDATPENVSRLLPVLLPVEELVTILCGSAPLLPGDALEVGVEGPLVLLTLGRGDLGQRVAVGEGGAVEWSRIRQRVRDGRGERDVAPAYDLAFASFRQRAGVRFPGEVQLDAPAGKARLVLSWKDDVEVNGAVDEALFRLAPPRGAKVVDLAPGASPPPVELPVEAPRG